jgi:hypothetical protein
LHCQRYSPEWTRAFPHVTKMTPYHLRHHSRKVMTAA